MYRLVMSLSVDGKFVVDTAGKQPTVQLPAQTIFHLSLSEAKLSDIVSALTCVSQMAQSWSSPKASQPGKPVADPEPSTSGAVIFYRANCKDCQEMIRQHPARELFTDPDGHLRRCSGPST